MLRVRELSVRFQTAAGSVAAVDGLSFDLQRGGSLALIGESGSGKTTAALSLLRLLPPGAQIAGTAELSSGRMAMVFHDPLAALNPVLRIGTQIRECLPGDGRERCLQLLREVGLGAEVAQLYPHQVSGGMRQRALIALALAGGPSVLIADEPTSALDWRSQAAVIEVLERLRRGGLALLLATHDLDLAARLCERIAVLHAGRLVERAPAADLLRAPRHPYTAGLLRSLPPGPGEPRTRLQPIAGTPPPPWALPGGCRFRDRCPRARPDCAGAEPPLVAAGVDREVACFHPLEAR